MSKWIAIPVIIVLVIAVAGGGYFSWLQTNNLGEAEADIVVLEDNVSNLEGDVADREEKLADSEAEVATLEADLTDAESQISSLESDYATSQSQVSSLQSQVSSAQGKYNSLKQEIDGCEPYAEILEKYFFVEAFYFEMSDIADVTNLVDDTGDTELEEKWEAWVDNPNDETYREFWFAVWDGIWKAFYGGTSL